MVHIRRHGRRGPIARRMDMGLSRFYVLECAPLSQRTGPSMVIDRAHNHNVICIYQSKW